MERLNTHLAKAGVGARRKVDALIEHGHVTVDGHKAVLGQKVEGTEDIRVNGERIVPPHSKKLIYIVLNKPAGYVTTVNDERGRKTVVDIVGSKERIFPVGRLDKDTTGVLLLTNDGEFAYKLTHPKHNIEKVYDVILDVPCSEKDKDAISRGLVIDGVQTRPCEIVMFPKDRRHVRIVLHEGRNRQIRKMFSARDYNVKKLDRISCASISYQGLKVGEWRSLTSDEVSFIESMVP
ncbi:MAG: pseudouridine synthase [bacterium]|nr:pseudouridine synthase [bacterium]